MSAINQSMQKILTITLNPSIDKTLIVPKLESDRKLHCKTFGIEPGGGGINVSRALQNLGSKSECWFLRGGFYGDFLGHLISQKDLEYRSFPIADETRENVIVSNESNKEQYLFDVDGPTVTAPEWQNILNAAAESSNFDIIVASGSLPPGVPDDFYAILAKEAKFKQVKLILDAPGKALELALREGVYLCKPNLKEFCALTGASPENLEDVKQKAKSLIESKSCSAVVVSLGAEGVLFVNENDDRHFTAPAVEKKSTVGAGDSMVAGIVCQLAQGADLGDAVLYGTASGTAATLHPGSLLCIKEDTDLLHAALRKKYC